MCLILHCLECFANVQSWRRKLWFLVAGIAVTSLLLQRSATADVVVDFYGNATDPRFETLMKEYFLSDRYNLTTKHDFVVTISYFIMGIGARQELFHIVDPKLPKIVLYDANQLGCYRLEKYPASTKTFYSLYFLLPKNWSLGAGIKTCVEKALSDISNEADIER